MSGEVSDRLLELLDSREGRRPAYRFASNEPTDANEVRTRLQKMSDEQLLRFGKAAAFMCSPQANFGEPPREAFVIQLREARVEWHRRHPPINS
jgi:hypothetical protein